MRPIPIKYTYPMIQDGILTNMSESLEILGNTLDGLNDKIKSCLSNAEQVVSKFQNSGISDSVDTLSELQYQIQHAICMIDFDQINESIIRLNSLKDRFETITSNVNQIEELITQIDGIMYSNQWAKDNLVGYTTVDENGEYVEPENDELTKNIQASNICACLHCPTKQFSNPSKIKFKYSDTINYDIMDVLHLYLLLMGQYHIPKGNVFVGSDLTLLASNVKNNPKVGGTWLKCSGMQTFSISDANTINISSPEDKTMFYLHTASTMSTSIITKLNQFKRVFILWTSSNEPDASIGFTVPTLILSAHPQVNNTVNGKKGIFGSELGRPLVKSFLKHMNAVDNPNYQTITYNDLIAKIETDISGLNVVNLNNFILDNVVFST